MIRETQIYLSRTHKDALRVAATISGRSCPEEQLEAVLADWLTQNPAIARYVAERARLVAGADLEARRIAGIEQKPESGV